MPNHNTLELLGESIETTDATVTTISTFQTVPGKGYLVTADVVAVDSAFAQGAGYRRYATFITTAAGVLSQVGSTATAATMETDSNWDCEIVATGTTIIVRVTGEADTTIHWRANVDIDSVGFGPENS